MHSLRCARRLPAALANAPQLATALSRAAAFSTSATSHRYATADYYDEQNPSEAGGDFVYRNRPQYEDDGRRPSRGSPPANSFSQIRPPGTTKLDRRQVIPPEDSAQLYSEFKPHKGVITPGPTDPPGHEPQEVKLLWRESSPPDRMLESLARLCYSPSYRIAKAPAPDTISSAELIGVQLAYGATQLPTTPRPMTRSYKEWKIGKGGASLEKAYRFPDAAQALRFANGLQFIMKIKIGKVDYLEHHADFAFCGRRVFVRWGTHEPQHGISSWDIYCAKRTDFWAIRCQVRDVKPETATWVKMDSLPNTLSPAIHRLVQVKNKLASGEAQGMSVNMLLGVKSDLLKASQDLVRVAKGVAEKSDFLVARHRDKGLATLEAGLESEMMTEEDLALEDMAMEESIERPGWILKGEWKKSPEDELASDEDEEDQR
ncbi:hypothetical protein ABW21_db0209221 [Orbilia brochopaga]|nr:hypothetical protein ABW21_db0209221 [Drechslerella brochopaga]